MKKQIIIFLLFIIFIQNNLNADILQELAKIDKKNPYYIVDYSSCVLYSKDGRFYTEYWNDGSTKPTIVAYKIQEDNIKLIIRVKTWDFAFRYFDYSYGRERMDQLTVDAHDYYLVELVYINDKLEKYCNRVRDINANGFIFNEAKIGENIKKTADIGHYPTYPDLKTDLTEGMKVKIAAFTNERTNDMKENSHSFEAYDYYYQILVNDQQVRINGYLLDFNNKVEYRSKLLILKSGNTPQEIMPQEALDYLGTWRYRGTGGIGFNERTITVTITKDAIHYHYIRNDDLRETKMEYGYTLINLTWTEIIRPDEDFESYVEMPNDHFKGASGYLITGTITDKTGDWSPDTDTITEYIYLRPNDKNWIYYYNYYVPSHMLRRISGVNN